MPGFTPLPATALSSPAPSEEEAAEAQCSPGTSGCRESSALGPWQRNVPVLFEDDSGAVYQGASAQRDPQDDKAEAIKHTSIYWLPVILFVAPGLNALMKYQIFL